MSPFFASGKRLQSTVPRYSTAATRAFASASLALILAAAASCAPVRLLLQRGNLAGAGAGGHNGQSNPPRHGSQRPGQHAVGHLAELAGAELRPASREIVGRESKEPPDCPGCGRGSRGSCSQAPPPPLPILSRPQPRDRGASEPRRATTERQFPEVRQSLCRGRMKRQRPRNELLSPFVTPLPCLLGTHEMTVTVKPDAGCPRPTRREAPRRSLDSSLDLSALR